VAEVDNLADKREQQTPETAVVVLIMVIPAAELLEALVW
jgi:hypothetical protein